VVTGDRTGLLKNIIINFYILLAHPVMRIEELHNFYASPSIIRVIMLRRMRWARHVAHMGEMK
jgi:hypothetical protein